MRKLTKEEINNAPVWANSVFPNSVGSWCWFDDETGMTQDFIQTGEIVVLDKNHYCFGRSIKIETIYNKLNN